MTLKLDPEVKDASGGTTPEEMGVMESVVAAAGNDPTALETKGEEKPAVEAPIVGELAAEPVPVAPAPTPEKPPVDLAALEKKIAELETQLRTPAAAVAPQPTAPAAPAWKPRAVVNVADVDKLVVGGQETADYVNGLLDSLRNDFAELTMLYVDTKLGPVENERNNAELERRTTEFKTKHKDLADWTDVAREQSTFILNDMQQRGLPFPGWDKFYDMIAERTKPIVDAYQKRFAPKGNGGSVPPPPTPMARGSVRGGTSPGDANLSGMEDKGEQEFIKAVVEGSY
jgi:hypothetical protein